MHVKKQKKLQNSDAAKKLNIVIKTGESRLSNTETDTSKTKKKKEKHAKLNKNNPETD